MNNSIWYQYNAPFDLYSYDFGYYDIFYYAVDFAGNIEDTNSFILHLVEEPTEPPPSPPSEPGIPGFNVTLLLFSIGLGFAYLAKRRLNFIKRN